MGIKRKSEIFMIYCEKIRGARSISKAESYLCEFKKRLDRWNCVYGLSDSTYEYFYHKALMTFNQRVDVSRETYNGGKSNENRFRR